MSEPILKYSPKAKNSGSINSIDDFLAIHYPSEATERSNRYKKHSNELSNLAQEHYLQASRDAVQNLQDHIESNTERIHTTLLMRSDQNLLDTPMPNWRIVTTYAQECPNLKSTLRNLTNRITDRGTTTTTDRRLMYDFAILEEWLKDQPEDTRILIVLEDADAFQTIVLNELIGYMHTFRHLPLRLVLNLNIPPMMFEERIDRLNMEKMDVKLIEYEPSAGILDDCTKYLLSNGVYLGECLKDLLARETPETMMRRLRYFIMEFYASHPLALLSRENVREYLPIVRRLITFRALAEASDENRQLIHNDDLLVDKVISTLDAMDSRSAGFLKELLIDNTDLYHDLFEPNYRHAMETALSEPSYFYEFSEPKNLKSCIPVCLSYELFRSADKYINIYDNFMMFLEEVARPEGISDEIWPRVVMAWFQQSVTELGKIGVVRTTKRKANSLEKASYKGV